MPTSAHTTSTELFVLHTLRCIGFVSLERAAEATGMTEFDTESELIDLAVAGLATRVSGEFGGWGLTEAGKAAAEQRITAELAESGARTAVAAAFQDFMVLNPELLDLCSAWQMRPVEGFMTPNDHRDTAYDAKVLVKLTEFNRRADAVCRALSSAMLRFQHYRTRLRAALDRARRGESDYVSDNTSSYHNVWFQLHEDLLVTLGIARDS